MNQPYQVVLDIWEANNDIDPVLLQANGVKGLIVRLNDMNGGHHMDAYFPKNWEVAKQFPVQAVYFVYNPWVDGQTNFNWLMAHLPSDYGKRRLFADIEVKYAGYAPKTYASEVSKFCGLVKQRFPGTRYTGGGFLELLDSWPVDEDYWWASYSTDLTNAKSWEDYRRILGYISYTGFTKLCPGKPALWQATGDGLRLPGFGNHAVDVNIFPGTEEALIAWFGCTAKEENPVGWTNNAIGFYTANPTGPAWDNPAYNFVAAYAGGNWTSQNGGIVLDPNPYLAPIEQKAHDKGMPCIAVWDFGVEWYSTQQIMAVEEKWPAPEKDYPLQCLINALKNRNPDALIIRVMNQKNLAGKLEMMEYVSFAAAHFITRANKWFYENKGLDKWTFVLSSDDFFHSKNSDGSVHAENFYSWSKNWWMGIEQRAILPLASNAWPQDTDKIKAIPPSLGWKLWYYYDTTALDLMIWNGDAAQMRTFINFQGQKDTIPPAPVTNLKALYTGQNVLLTWTGSTSSDVASYIVACNGVKLTDSPACSYTFDGEQPGSMYVFEVVAKDKVGNLSTNEKVSITIPGVPQTGDPITRDEFNKLKSDFESVVAKLRSV